MVLLLGVCAKSTLAVEEVILTAEEDTAEKPVVNTDADLLAQLRYYNAIAGGASTADYQNLVAGIPGDSEEAIDLIRQNNSYTKEELAQLIHAVNSGHFSDEVIDVLTNNAGFTPASATANRTERAAQAAHKRNLELLQAEEDLLERQIEYAELNRDSRIPRQEEVKIDLPLSEEEKDEFDLFLSEPKNDRDMSFRMTTGGGIIDAWCDNNQAIHTRLYPTKRACMYGLANVYELGVLEKHRLSCIIKEGYSAQSIALSACIEIKFYELMNLERTEFISESQRLKEAYDQLEKAYRAQQ